MGIGRRLAMVFTALTLALAPVLPALAAPCVSPGCLHPMGVGTTGIGAMTERATQTQAVSPHAMSGHAATADASATDTAMAETPSDADAALQGALCGPACVLSAAAPLPQAFPAHPPRAPQRHDPSAPVVLAGRPAAPDPGPPRP